MSPLNFIILLSFLFVSVAVGSAYSDFEGNNQHESVHLANEHSRVKRQFFPGMGGMGFPMGGMSGFPMGGMGGGFPGMGFGGMPYGGGFGRPYGGGGGFWGRRRSYMRGYRRGFQRGRWGGGRGWYG